jgi:PBP1b-binding outer membrane lipoprotein LpoB
MKRKLLSIILIATMVFGGCGTTASTDGQSNVTVKDNRTTETEDLTKEDATSVTVKDNRQNTAETATSNVKVSVSDSDFDKVGYLYENSIGTTYYYLIITNNSTVPVSVSGNGVAKDADGNSVGAGNTSIDILGAGETSICYFYFSNVANVASVDYSLSYDTNPYYYPVVGNLSVEQTLNDKNVTVSVT